MKKTIHLYEEDGIWQASRVELDEILPEDGEIVVGNDTFEYGAIIELLNKESAQAT